MDKRRRQSQYNIDIIDSVITCAILGEKKVIYIEKSVVKLAKQMLKDRRLSEKIKIKTV